MTQKELDKLILDQIYEGKSHREVYEDFNQRFPNREIDIARLVASHVTMTQRNRYQVHNVILIVVMVLNVALGVYLAFAGGIEDRTIGFVFDMLFPALYVYLLVGVLRWNARTYRQVGALGVIRMLKLVFFATGTAIGGKVSLGLLEPTNLLPMAMVALGFYLYGQLGGKYKTASQQYTDAKGQIRARHKIQFEN